MSRAHTFERHKALNTEVLIFDNLGTHIFYKVCFLVKCFIDLSLLALANTSGDDFLQILYIFNGKPFCFYKSHKKQTKTNHHNIQHMGRV